MDSLNASESKSGHSNSLGLLDIQDLSLDLNSKSIKETVKEKPPIPNKKKRAKNEDLLNPNIDFNNLEDTQNLEASVVSIKLNESDLKELEDEFTFDEDDEDDNDEDGIEKKNPGSKLLNEIAETNNEDKLHGTSQSHDSPRNLTLVKRFDGMDSNSSNSDLLSESANILMVSSEFSKINKSEISFGINYDNMDKLNDMTHAEKSINMTMPAVENTQMFNDSDMSFKQNSTRNEFINQTVDNFNNQSTIDRMNQMVMQSVERVKRKAMIYKTDDFLDSLNGLKHLDAKNHDMTADEKDGRRFSANSIKTQSSKFNNDTINNMTNISTPGRTINETNRLQDFKNLEVTPSQFTHPAETTLNDETISFTEKITELASIYFKPCQSGMNDTNMTPSIGQPPKVGSNQEDLTGQKQDPEHDYKNMFKPHKVMFDQNESIFIPMKENEIEEGNNVTISEEKPDQTTQNTHEPANDNMCQPHNNEDHLFKPQSITNDSMFIAHTINDDSIFKCQSLGGNRMQNSKNQVNGCFFEKSQEDHLFQAQQIANDSMFQPRKNNACESDQLFQSSSSGTDDSMFKDPSQLTNNFAKSDESFSKPKQLMNDSIFGAIPPCNISMFQSNEKNNDDSIFKSQASSNLNSADESTSSFKSGSAFMNELAGAEEQNRREFASNDLTVLSSDDKENSCENGNSDKWWNLSIQQTSKLELSNMSNSFEKKVYAVDDYFNQKSEMPQYLADKEHGVAISDDEKKRRQSSSDHKLPAAKDSSDENDSMANFTLSSATMMTTGRATSNNFSFTFNASESGDFIQKKNMNEKVPNTPQTPFQITKMLNKKTETETNAAITASAPVLKETSEKLSSSKPNPSNLKTIGEELDRVSNRLAHTNTHKTEFKVPEIPLQIHQVSLEANSTSKVPDTVLPQIDETISSINTTSNITADLKSGTNHKLVKPFTTQQNHKLVNSSHSQNNKQKLTSGSLTSTPSKLKSGSQSGKTSAREKNLSYKNSEQKSDINMTSTNSTISSTSNSTNYLFNQESFISSIPERTNDSTLVGNHHQLTSHANLNKKNATSSKIANFRNAEIQTTPGARLIAKCENFANTSTIVTTTLSSTTTTDIHEKLTESDPNLEENKMRSSLSSSDLATSALTSQMNNINALTAQMLLNNQNSQSSNRSTMLNNSNSSTTSNQLHPVMFLSIQQITSLMNEMQTSPSQKDSTNLSSNSTVTNNQTNISSTSINSANNQSFNKFELPEIEINKTCIDFGQIAEGCRDVSRILLTITNPSVLNQQNIGTSSLLIEFEDYSNWNIENFDSHTGKITEVTNKYDDLKPVIAKTLSLNLNKLTEKNRNYSECGDKLKIDMVTNYYEFFVHLDTRDLTIFKELLRQQQLIKQQKNSRDSNFDHNTIHPLSIGTNLSIYYCINSNNETSISSGNKKYLVKRIDLKYILGYARIKTSSLIDHIEFEIYDHDGHDQIDDSKKNESCYDIDKTLMSLDDSSASNSSVKCGKNLEKLIPMGNAGNIDIDVTCYFRFDDGDMNKSNIESTLKLLKFKHYEVRIIESIIRLPANSKQKRHARLVLIKLLNELGNMQKHLDIFKSYKFIIQVQPNGILYEIPFKIKVIDKAVPKIHIQAPSIVVSKSSTRLKVATSKSDLFFGKGLNPRHLSQISQSEPLSGQFNEVMIKNLNDFTVKYQLVTHTFEVTDGSNFEKSQFNIFKFLPEMYESSFCVKKNESHKMDNLMILLNPQEEIIIKLKFDPSLLKKSSQSHIHNGVLRIGALGYTERFTVRLVGFLNSFSLEIDRVAKLRVDLSTMDSLRIQKQLHRQCLTQSNYSLQVSKLKTQNSNPILKKSIRLKNISMNSKAIIYPICYLTNQNTDIVCQLSDLSMKNNEKSCLVEIDGFSAQVNLHLNEIIFFQYDQLVWFELDQNEEIALNIEIELLRCNKGVKSSDFERRFHQNFSIAIFNIASDLNIHCFKCIKQLEANNASTNDSQKYDIALNGKAFRLENFLNKVMTNNHLGTSAYGANILNMSTTSSSSLAELSKSKLIDSSALFNASIVHNNKSKIRREDYYKLICQSIKCSILNISTMSIDHSIDDSFNTSNCSMNSRNDTIKNINSDGLNISTNAQENWSVDTDSIVIQGIRSDALHVFTYKLKLTNNTDQKLHFMLTNRPNYIDVTPNSLILKPFEKYEIKINPRNDVINKLPLTSVLSVTCNRVKKDIKVSLSGANSRMPVSSNRKNTSLTQKKPSSMNKSNLNSSTSSIPSSLSHSASTPICAKPSLSLSSNNTTLEQGTLISELTQHTMDSLSLTPLISASFSSLSSSKSESTSSLAKLKSLKRDSNESESSLIKILHFGNYAQIKFPPVYVAQSKSYDLTLINPTNSFVNWKAYATVNPYIRDRPEQTDYKNIFNMKPHSGSIAAKQKQTIKIEFSPGEASGLFTQNWEIDTFTDANEPSNDPKTNRILSNVASYNCKLVLNGQSMPTDAPLDSVEDDCHLRLNNRILKTKSNALNIQRHDLENSINNRSNISKLSDKSLKENKYNSTVDKHSYNAGTSFSKSLLSASTTSSIGSTKAVMIKEEQVVFTDVAADKMSKSYVTINNKEDGPRNIRIMSMIEPFYCKHSKVEVLKNHYTRIPIEFRPRVKGEYLDKILIRVEGYENSLSCLVKAKCI